MDKPAAAVPIGTADDRANVPRSIPRKSKNFKQSNLVGYLFVSPWLLGFLLFALVPMAISLVLAFTDYDILGSANFIGFGNFQRMFFEDPRYWRSVIATFRYVAIAVPLRLAFALLVAMLLNTHRRGVYWYTAVSTRTIGTPARLPHSSTSERAPNGGIGAGSHEPRASCRTTRAE